MRKGLEYRVLRSSGSSRIPVDRRHDRAGGSDPYDRIELTAGRGEPLPDWFPPRRRASDRTSPAPTWGERVWLAVLRVRALARRVGGSLIGRARVLSADPPTERFRWGRGRMPDGTRTGVVEEPAREWTDAGPRSR